jgi:hypothetical protein
MKLREDLEFFFQLIWVLWVSGRDVRSKFDFLFFKFLPGWPKNCVIKSSLIVLKENISNWTRN